MEQTITQRQTGASMQMQFFGEEVMTVNDDVVMMLTEKGMRILLDELRKHNPDSVLAILDKMDGQMTPQEEEPEVNEKEVNDLVSGYMDYKRNDNEKSTVEVVADYLKERAEPVRLADIREYLGELGIVWRQKSSSTNMKTIMKRESRIEKVGFGLYGYVDEEESEAREISET